MDFNRAVLLMLIMVAPAGFSVIVANGLQNAGLPSFLSWVIIAVYMVVWIVFVAGFQTFKLKEK